MTANPAKAIATGLILAAILIAGLAFARNEGLKNRPRRVGARNHRSSANNMDSDDEVSDY